MALDISKYKRTIRVPKYTGPIGIFHSGVGKPVIKRWFQTYMPGLSVEDHVSKRDEAVKMYLNRSQEYDSYLHKEFKKKFGRKYHLSDYKVSGVVRDEFSDRVKNKLGRLIREYQDYRDIAYAHNIMLPAKRRKQLQ